MSTRPVFEARSDRFGSHRVLEPKGALPQPAERLDNDFSRLFSGELLISVETLNVDAASFRQMEEDSRSHGEPEIEGVSKRVLETVARRGKQHNPITGSGGMLLGKVAAIAKGRDPEMVAVGDKIASLISLSLTPLRIDRISAIRAASAQLDIEGEAVLFASSPYAKMPADMSERLALAVLDVAGAAPQVARLVRENMCVVVFGAGGKSGILCAVEARRCGGKNAFIVGVESHSPFADDLEALGICDAVVRFDARDPLGVYAAVMAATKGREADVTFSCVNVGGAELSVILCTRDRGTAYFFAMSTSFTQAALGAEGVGKDVDLMIGNGYAHDHAGHSLQMVREFPHVRALFERRYG